MIEQEGGLKAAKKKILIVYDEEDAMRSCWTIVSLFLTSQKRL